VRGLLFLTLRRHYGAWQSALFSSLLFSAAQFYSLPGLAAMTWEGFVYAMALEMSKSLVPNIAGQVLTSAVALTALWAFWR
jgi:membrane protease YdiL (CAAX protease family)